MKKIFSLILTIIVVGTSLATLAADPTPAQKRKAERQTRDSLYAIRLNNALQDQTLYFRGQFMQIKNLDRYDLYAPYNYVDLTPGYLRVQLPYFTSVNTMGNAPKILDFESQDFAYSVTEHRGVYTVVLDVRSVQNERIAGSKTASLAYKLMFVISPNSSANVNLTITPNFTSPLTYTGNIELM